MRLSILPLVLLLAACGNGASPSPDAGAPLPDAAADAPDAATSPDAGTGPIACEAILPIESKGVALFADGGTVEAIFSSELGLARGKVGFDKAKTDTFFPADPKTTLPHVRPLQTAALEVPGWSLDFVNDLREPLLSDCARQDGASIAGLLLEMDARNNMAATGIAPLRQEGEPLEALLDAEAPLVAAFDAVFHTLTPWKNHVKFPSFVTAKPQVEALAAALDEPTERALAAVILGMAKAEEWRLEAVRIWYHPNPIDYAELGTAWLYRNISIPRARSFNYALMGRAGIALAGAVERLVVHLAAHPLPADLSFRLATPLGEVVISGGASDDTYTGGPAIVIDAAGQDTYQGVIAGPVMESIPLAVAIDLSGDDKYLAPGGEGTQGAGVLSFGFLFDMAGNDQYLADSFAQGTGALGVGVLFDAEGQDAYSGGDYVQGAGQFGYGALIDGAGNDSYYLVKFGQGYGYTRSVGLLFDRSGDDTYEAEDDTLINPSAQNPQHNSSMAQGMGFGARGSTMADTMSGGTGLLIDLDGADHYRCGLFCQGAGYWFASGILFEGGGNDTYQGIWYTQGGAAHMAFGTLIDEAGNDNYVVKDEGAASPGAGINMSNGAGHDGSIGYLIESGGDDKYSVSNLSHGAANDVGVGIFVEVAGADVYGTDGVAGISFGQTGAIDLSAYGRSGVSSLALFLDQAGADQYLIAPAGAKNGATWKLPGQGWAPSEHKGIGQDAE